MDLELECRALISFAVQYKADNFCVVKRGPMPKNVYEFVGALNDVCFRQFFTHGCFRESTVAA